MITTFAEIVTTNELAIDEGVSQNSNVIPRMIEACLSKRLKDCQRVLRWAIVKTQTQASTTQFWLEGAYHTGN